MTAKPQSTRTTSRRTFIAAAAGAAATASALPALAGAASTTGAEPAELGGLLAALRAAYVANLERLAETLRPRFKSGELHSYRDEDEDKKTHEIPHEQIVQLAAAHFGLDVTKTTTTWGDGQCEREVCRGDSAAAYQVLLASPHADVARNGQPHPCSHAADAVAWDLIALARERGWYTPTADECEPPTADQAW